MSLCEKFLEDKGLTEASKELKGVVGACLFSIIIEPQNKYMEKFNFERETVVESIYTKEVLEDKAYLRLLDIARYWYNDLLDVLNEYLKKEGYTGVLWKEDEQLSSMVFFDWIKERYGF